MVLEGMPLAQKVRFKTNHPNFCWDGDWGNELELSFSWNSFTHQKSSWL